MIHRRDVLKVIAASALATMLPRTLRAKQRRLHPDDRPRYFVFVCLDGGMDAIYTTAPRLTDQVASGVDVPYPRDAIRTFGPNVVGPHLALLGEHARDLCIINGVGTHALNHVTGSRQNLRFRRDADRRMPTIMSLLGAKRDGQPVAELYVSFRSSDPFTPSFLGSLHPNGPKKGPDFYDVLESTPPEDLRRLARVYRGHRDRLAASDPRLAIATTASHFAECARLFERVAELRPMTPLAPMPDAAPGLDRVAEQLQRVLWILENDLAACVVTADWNWDSHYDNHAWQTRMSRAFFPALAGFVDGLKQRTNRHGRLWDQTVVVVASEIGRFPRLNHLIGKDHFPEIPILMLGGRVTPGTFGVLGKEMQALPISLETGRAARGGVRLTLDDLGAHLLTLGGLDPLTYGYTGRPLEFLHG